MSHTDIDEFIKAHEVMTVACVDNNGAPYCFNAFYTYSPYHKLLVFSSAPQGTYHAELLNDGVKVSGTILAQMLSINNIKGVQLCGQIMSEEILKPELLADYRQKYVQSQDIPHKIWGIALTFLKLTDNSKGFGHKDIWEKNDF